jgi:Cdc6-like AAA superfamily ATPase
MNEAEGDVDGPSSDYKAAPPSPTPVRRDYLDGLDAASGQATSLLNAGNPDLGGVRISSVMRETLVSSPDAPEGPPADPPSPNSSSMDAPQEPLPEDANDVSRNRAMLVGQGPTHVETVARDDALAREAITEALVALLRNRFNTEPLTIGLFGAWGSGKSSQVGFVKKSLGEPAPDRPTIRVIEFNAWEHEKCDNLSAALAQTVVEKLIQDTSLTEQWHLARQLAARKRAHVTKAAGRDLAGLHVKFYQWIAPFMSFEAASAAVIILLVLLTNMPLALKGAFSAAAAWVAGWKAFTKYLTDNLTGWFKRIAGGAGGGPFGLPDYAAKLGTFHEIRQTLQHLVSLRVGDEKNAGKGEYLLVVVDDLDRCSVGTIKLVLDAVRLVTSLPRVVTMVAVDDRIAFPAVESFFEQFKGSGRDASVVARDYLAKVFNVSITLPPVPEKLATDFIKNRLFADVYGGPVEADVRVTGSESGGTAIPDDTALVTDEEVREFTRLALAIGMTNPRALWRMKQAWYLLRNMALTFDPDPSFEPWMRSMFVREAVLAQPAEVRREVERWATFIRREEPPSMASSIPSNLAGLLREDRSDVTKCWHYADIVLLPAAVGAAAT